VKTYFQTNVFKPIYDHYSTLGICTQGAAYGACTIKELTYAQWINQSILLNPPDSINMQPSYESYVRLFPDWTSLSFTPELGYFLAKAELPSFPVAISDVITFMQPNRLFN
jgi:hypothetical protein